MRLERSLSSAVQILIRADRPEEHGSHYEPMQPSREALTRILLGHLLFLFRTGSRTNKSVVQDENTSHFLTRSHSLIGMIRHGGAIVGQDNAVVFGGPGENIGIVRARQSYVLHANEIEARLTQQQAAHDVAVEVLIRKQPQHGRSSRLSPGKQSRTDITQVALLSFNPLPGLFGFLLALCQVAFDFAAMT
jgi:hypothetical protein